MDAFAAEVAKEDLHLARACLLAARDFSPTLDVDAALARFDPWVRRVAERPANEDVPTALRRVLAQEEGFRGETATYYAAENSLLDHVLERRRGLPITLCVVYLEVARRLGEPLVAVGMPGHFLVRHEETLLDPFHEGRVLTRDDCQRLLDGVSAGRLRLAPEMLRPTPDRDVLARVLANLKGTLSRAGRAREALRVVERALQVHPYAFEERRDRGLLRIALGDPGGREDLRAYVQALPKAADAERIRSLLGI